MNTKQLKQKILDLAIKGKLVPQDPNDEPASKLIERIREEKEQLIKEGKLKRDKNESYIFVGDDKLHYEKFSDGSVVCIEDEIPFEIPESWAWEKFGNISNIARGGSPRPIEAYLTNAENGINWIKIGDTEKGEKYIYSTKEKIKPEGISKSRYVKAGDFLLTNSMSFGRPYILKTDGCIHDGWLVINDDFKAFNQDFLYYLLSSDIMYQLLALSAKGSTVQNLKSDTVKDVYVAIPPKSEQKRIAEYIENLLSIVENIDINRLDLSDLIKQTKAKVLDLAIKGKLVPQDLNDEPADKLLEKIREEKEKLIKEGKLKRDKNETFIFKNSDDNSYYEQMDGETVCIDDDLPFEIPDSWRWCRLRDIYNVCSSKRVLQSDWKAEGVPFYRAREIVKLSQQGFVENELYITNEHYETLKANYGIPIEGDVMVSGVGTIGKAYVVKSSDKFYYKDASVLCFKRYSKFINSNLFKYLIESYFMQKQLNANSNGTTVDTITISSAGDYLYPLASYKEQDRILLKVESIFSYLDNLESIIKGS